MLFTRDMKIVIFVNEKENYDWLIEQPIIKRYVDYVHYVEDGDYDKAYSFIMNKFNTSKDNTLIITQKMSEYEKLRSENYYAFGMYTYAVDVDDEPNDRICKDFAHDLVRIEIDIVEENPMPEIEIDNYKVKRFIDGYEISGIVNHIDNLYIPAYIGGKKIYRVGRDAFEGMTFSTITFKEGVRDIDICAFHKVKGVKELILPKSIKMASLYAFSSAEWERIVFLGYIENTFSSFEGLHRLKELVFPSEWKRIGFRCFWCSDSIEELYLPEGMKEIGMQGFNNCPNLKVVHLPKSMKRIADSAFYRCPSLKTVYYNGSKEDKEKITIVEPNDSNRRLMEAEWIYAE